MLGGNETVGATAFFGVGPTMHTGDMHPRHFSDDGRASTLLDNSRSRVHGAQDCVIRNRPSSSNCDIRSGGALRNSQTAVMDIEWIREQFSAKPSKSQKGLAETLGIDPAGVNRMMQGKRQIKAYEIPKIRAYFDAPEISAPAKMPTADPIPLPRPGLDLLPIVGAAEGGPDGLMEWNGDVIDRVARPPHLAGARDAYALFVRGTSMEPRYVAGELLYVHPGRPVTPECFVVIQFFRENDGPTPVAWVKQFVRQDSKCVTLRQFNPSKMLKVPSEQVRAIHRIVGSGEA